MLSLLSFRTERTCKRIAAVWRCRCKPQHRSVEQRWQHYRATVGFRLWYRKMKLRGGTRDSANGTVFYTGSSDCSFTGSHSDLQRCEEHMEPGPDFPSNDAANDAPAAIETNGNVIVMASLYTGTFTALSNFYEWNGSTLNGFPAPPNAVNDASFVGHLLVLPTGQIMFTDFTTDVEILTTAGSFKGSGQPTIKSAPTSVSAGVPNYLITGTPFNRLSQGAAYGDDFQDATNYPLVRIVNTYTWSHFLLQDAQPRHYGRGHGQYAGIHPLRCPRQCRARCEQTVCGCERHSICTNQRHGAVT